MHRGLLLLAVSLSLLAAAEEAAAPAPDRFEWAAGFLAEAGAPMRVAVDLRDLPESGLIHARLRLDAEPGMQLAFARWVPGIHAPRGAVENIGRLVVRDAAGATVHWDRDSHDPWRFHLNGLEAAGPVSIDLSYIANQPSTNSKGVDVFADAGTLICNWNNTLLYRPELPVAEQPVVVQAHLPAGWGWGCALPTAADAPADAAVVRFAPSSIARVVDSPLIAGRGYRRHELHAEPRVSLHVAGADRAAATLDPRWVAALERLPEEAHACFGGAHYEHYDFLLLSSDRRIGLEHARSSLNGLSVETLTDLDQASSWDVDLLPHEYVHSWVGKFRRPAGMWTPDYHATKALDGLWIYEGLTMYYGMVLAARCGLVEPAALVEDFDHLIARHAAQRGRRWRSLRDCCRASYLLRGHSDHHHDLRRGQDYYTEGALFWLMADLRIRAASDGARSLDDLCRSFFGPQREPGPFTEDELVAALAELAEHDWRGEIERRIDRVAPELDTVYLELSGWRREYGERGLTGEEALARARPSDAARTVGLHLRGRWVSRVEPDSPAARAGLAAGDYIHSVNDVLLEEEPDALLRGVVASAEMGGGCVLHVFREGDWMHRGLVVDGTVRLYGLHRDPERVDRLGAILQPRTWERSPEPAAGAEPAEDAAGPDPVEGAAGTEPVEAGAAIP